ncbi:MAG: hypothetical protein ACFFB3_03785 [Candidatus Hodarchaeota archaeon]
MTQLESIFNLGHKFGEIIRQVEMAIETKSWRHCQVEIEVYRVYESLMNIIDELIKLDASEIFEKTQQDIKLYLEKLTTRKIDAEEDQEEEYEMLIARIKKKIKKRKQKRKLKSEEITELDSNLKVWKDRFANEFIRKSKEIAIG